MSADIPPAPESPDLQPNEPKECSDEVKPRPIEAPVTLSLLVVIAVIHIVLIFTGLHRFAIGHYGLIVDLVSAGEYWRLFTATLLHQNWTHLGSNMLGIWVFGDRMQLEVTLGSRNTLILLLASGIFGNLLSCLFLSKFAVSFGASGMAYGLTGGYIGIILFLHKRLANIPSPQQALFKKQYQQELRTMLILGIVFVFLHFQEPQLNLWAHVGGLITGILLAPQLLPKKRSAS